MDDFFKKKLEIGKFDDQVSNLLEKNTNLDRRNEELNEKINAICGESDFLRNENQNLKLNNEILVKENDNLRRNNQEYLFYYKN